MKRIVLFILTNLAVMLVLSVVFNLLAASGVLGPYGNPGTLGGLLVFSAIFGMGGAFISLALSKWMARMATGAQVIDKPRNADEAWLKSTVERLARQAGIGTPDLAVYDSPQPNAFATGMRRDHALVAVSTGLMQGMNRDQVEAVLGHEITHVANGDMVTLTLLQGVLNTFVIALSRIVATLVGNAMSRDREDRGMSELAYFVTSLLAQILFGILASLIVMAFSRWREFRADAGGARLAGRNKMIAALQRLQGLSQQPADLPKQMQAFGIADGGSMMKLFMSHPPIEERISALQKLQHTL
jgi:heat shock protein HtpX